MLDHDLQYVKAIATYFFLFYVFRCYRYSDLALKSKRNTTITKTKKKNNNNRARTHTFFLTVDGECVTRGAKIDFLHFAVLFAVIFLYSLLLNVVWIFFSGCRFHLITLTAKLNKTFFSLIFIFFFFGSLIHIYIHSICVFVSLRLYYCCLSANFMQN